MLLRKIWSHVWKRLRQINAVKNIHLFILKYRYREAFKQLKKTKGEERFLIFLTPAYENLGDQAIYLAEKEFLKRNFSEKSPLGITGELYRKFRDEIKQYITERDIIMVTGGGFLGSLWSEENTAFLNIVEDFQDNPILVFPQTVYFHQDEEGKHLVMKMRQVLKGHRKIFFCARDKATYNIMLENNLIEKEKIALLPDMVTFLDEVQKNYQIEIQPKVLFCLRNDPEKISHGNILDQITKKITENHLEIEYSDTVKEAKLYEKEMVKKISAKWSLFAKYRLIVTDRLHGMLFATILGRPCIVLDNCSGKVEGTYQWLSYLDYVKFVREGDNVSNKIDYLLKKQIPCLYENGLLLPFFKQLVNVIKEMMNNEGTIGD